MFALLVRAFKNPKPYIRTLKYRVLVRFQSVTSILIIKNLTKTYLGVRNDRWYLIKKLNESLIYFFSGNHLIGSLKAELKASGDLSKGIGFLKKKYPLFKPRSIRFLIYLYRYMMELEDPIKLKSKKKKDFIVHFCCWGDDYTEKAINFLLPSLLATGNLPALSKEYEITLLIHCDAKSKLSIENAKVIQSIQKVAQLHIVVLPSALFKFYKSLTTYPEMLFLKTVNRVNHGIKYLLLGALQAHALRIGIKRGSLVSFLIPDSILSDSFFSYSIEKIQNKKLILTSTFRTNCNQVSKYLAKFYLNQDKTVCAVSGAALANLQIEYLHATERRRVISQTTNHFLACARFIFKTNDGLILRAVHYHPVLIDCNQVKGDLKIDYFPIDDSVLKQILVDDVPYEEQVWVCSDSNSMNFMELSGDDPEVNEPPVFVAASTYESLIHSVYLLFKACPKDLDEKLNRFFIKNKLLFVGEHHFHSDDEVINSDDFLTDLYAKIDAI